MARVEPHGVGSFMHVIKHASRGMEIARDEEDRVRFLRSLFYLNDRYSNDNWKRDIANLSAFDRPAHWPEQEPLVNILAWALLSNHFHLLLQERVEGGIAKFMQRMCNSMTKSFNEKYKERGKGSLFQGSYKGKTVESDTYLRQLIWYVAVKNTLEQYPGGISAALEKFDNAWDWGLAYKYSSLGVCVRGGHSPVLADPDGIVRKVFKSPRFKKDAKDLLSSGKFRSDELKNLAFETW